MRAMILAAGRGERMRPLTDTCPKPLLQVGGHPLIVWNILRLARAGIRDILINHAWLGEQIVAQLGDGHTLGVHLTYSAESPVLETAGGIARALPFFEGQTFLLINGDIWCDWNPAVAAGDMELSPTHAAHLVLVDTPPHHSAGDFTLRADGHLALPAPGTPTLTYAGIGLFHPSLFAHTDPTRPAPLAPLLRQAIALEVVTGERHSGQWVDVGTPERLEQLDEQLGGTCAAGC